MYFLIGIVTRSKCAKLRLSAQCHHVQPRGVKRLAQNIAREYSVFVYYCVNNSFCAVMLLIKLNRSNLFCGCSAKWVGRVHGDRYRKKQKNWKYIHLCWLYTHSRSTIKKSCIRKMWIKNQKQYNKQ